MMRNKSNLKLITTVILLLLVPAFTYSQSKPSYSKEINEKIKQVENNLVSWVKLDSISNWNMYQRMKDLNVNGLSIAVINNFKIEWIKSYGLADTTEKRPITNQTLFQSASIGKSVNGFAYMKLVQNGKVDLSKDISLYLKSWKFPYDSFAYGKKITVNHLLSHTAGLSVHGFDGYKWSDTLPGIKQILDGVKPANNPTVRSIFEPGQKFEYSGGGYEISELLAENLTSQPYQSFIEEIVFKPLKMKNSTYAMKPADGKCATAYRFDRKEIGCKYHLYPEKACGAGLWTTATDLAKFVIEIQLSLEGKSNKVIDSERTKLMLTPHLQSSNYGMGFFVDNSWALMVIPFCMFLGDKLPKSKVIGALVKTGQMTLSHYVIHMTIGVLLLATLTHKHYSGFPQSINPVETIYILIFAFCFFR